MSFGVSTACFYPIDTKSALLNLAQFNVKKTEVFLNTFSEVEDGYIQTIKQIVEQNCIDVVSVHPFSSLMEGFFFASDYATRFDDGVKIYRRMFEACQALNAKILVFHGDYKQNPFEFNQYCLNYKKLRAIASEYGVNLCQENVVRCKSHSTKNILRMRDVLHDDIDFVLDTKQVRRNGEPLQDMLCAMQNKIRHIHISDYTQTNDCVLAGKGEVDFISMAKTLQAQNYQGDIILEVYNNAYTDPCELYQAVNWLEQTMQPFLFNK